MKYRKMIIILLLLLIIAIGCEKKKNETNKEEPIPTLEEIFENKNIMTCTTTYTPKGVEVSTTAKYIFEFDENDEKIINDIGFEEHAYVSDERLEKTPYEDNKEYYEATYCYNTSNCYMKLEGNTIITYGTYTSEELGNIFLSKNRAEIKKGLENGTLHPYVNPYVCD